MFARLFMFAFIVFFAHSALASQDFSPRLPNDKKVESQTSLLRF